MNGAGDRQEAAVTGAAALVDILVREGVPYVFGLIGTDLVAVIDELYRRPEIEFVASQHEQGAIYMAEGWARCTRATAVCLVSFGAGTSNAVSGVAEAYNESSPVVVISPVVASHKAPKDRSNFHWLDQVGLMRPITKASLAVTHASQLPEMLRKAFRIAGSGRPGPVYVAISRQIFEREIAYRALDPAAYRPLSRPAPNEDDVAAAVRILASARQPLLLAGGGVLWSRAEAEVVRLAERLEAPIALTYARSGLIPDGHPLCVGRPERSFFRRDNPVYNEIVGEVDAILAVGTAMSERTTSAYDPAIIPPSAKLIQVDIDPEEIGKTFPVALGVVGDARATLSRIDHELERAGAVAGTRRGLAERLAALKAQEQAKWRAQATSDAVPISRFRVVQDVAEALGPEAVISGSDTWREMLHCTHRYAVGDGGDYGTAMGSGYCRCLALKLAEPETRVAWVGGDGSFMMVLAEIGTAVARNLPVLAVICHDGAYGSIKRVQARRFERRFSGVDLPIPDLAGVATAFGAYGERVERPGEIGPAVRRALASGKPAVLDVIVDGLQAGG